MQNKNRIYVLIRTVLSAILVGGSYGWLAGYFSVLDGMWTMFVPIFAALAGMIVGDWLTAHVKQKTLSSYLEIIMISTLCSILILWASWAVYLSFHFYKIADAASEELKIVVAYNDIAWKPFLIFDHIFKLSIESYRYPLIWISEGILLIWLIYKNPIKAFFELGYLPTTGAATMSQKLMSYKQAQAPLPKTYLAWELYGAGLDSLGKSGKPVELPLRDPMENEVLLRVDAIGLCFSDTKLIFAGSEHPRVYGRNLVDDPVVPGHEAALTVVKVGAKWASRFFVGDRFIIQADIFINGAQKAFGYVQRGAMAQYCYVNEDVLNGDDGCYLLPLKSTTRYAEAALVEPWACVDGAYNLTARIAPLDKGSLLVVNCGGRFVDTSELYLNNTRPGLIVEVGIESGAFQSQFAHLSVKSTVYKEFPTSEQIAEYVKNHTEGVGFDDILLIGDPSSRLIEACDKALANNGYLVLLPIGSLPRAMFDIGRVHYHDTRHIGTLSDKPLEAYKSNIREELLPGGICWMVGAAGPMGQMHVQRALELKNPPKKILATDISDERLSYMESRLRPLAEKRGIEFELWNVAAISDLDVRLCKFTAGNGFDDIYVHAPVPSLVSYSAGILAKGSVLNIFAGVPIGTFSSLPANIFVDKHTRMIGSSGSSMADILCVLNKCETDELATGMSLSAVGSIEAVWDGIKGVKEGRFPGKTVIWPHISELPLMSISELKELCPVAYAALGIGGVWTREAEDIFLERFLK